MRIVVVGATGNVGTSLLRALIPDPAVDSVVGVARRRPEIDLPKTEWVTADVSRDRLGPVFAGADVVVHLAWAIQPSRDLPLLRAINVGGTRRVLEGVAEAKVPSFIYASSVGAYSPGPKDRRIDETWPVGGIRTSFYSRHKAETETMLDRFESERPAVRVVRLRPALIFKREAAEGQRRLFMGPLLPSFALRRGLMVMPNVHGLVFQAVHSYDVGEAYRLAALGDARGAYNVAAEPILDPPRIAELLGAHLVPLPRQVLRAGAALTWRLRLQPSPKGWADMGLQAPLLDATKAREVLGWGPRHTSEEAILDLVEGLREGAGAPTPPLEAGAGGPLRVKEFLSGVGKRP